jgi:fumarylacetoacetase
MIDDTHDAARRSWVASANGHPDFPLQNLPLAIFSTKDGRRRAGVAIGDAILDLPAALAAGLLSGDAARAVEATGDTLNGLFALGAAPRQALRARLFALLSEGAPDRAATEPLLHPASACTLHLPARIGDYTDFYAGIHHARNGGLLFRPDNPLMPNYKYVPVGYHGRASSVRPSPMPVRRPNGQRKLPDEPAPSYGPCRNLDYELEMGIWIGPGNEAGSPIPIGDAANHIAGFCLLNDWSARDIQSWESQPLGPFLAKSFQTSISPWVITPEALAPFRAPRPPRPNGDPAPLPHLFDAADQASGALDLALEVTLHSARMRADGAPPARLSLGNALHLYWTCAQMVAHHASNGCDLRPGDLFGTGTISTPEPGGWGALMEITRGGREPVTLPNGEVRTFLEDGDEITLHARAARPGFASIGFGPCRGLVLPAASAA